MQKLVFINANGVELDLTSDPFGITEWEGFSADELNIQSQQVPFQDGAVFLDALLVERELAVTVAMNDGNNLAYRYELRREMISALNPKLGEGVLIYTNDYLSKQIHCIPQLPVFENHNSNDSGTPKVSCVFTACNPYWEDLEDTVVDINTGEIETIENLGDVPAQVQIEMIGVATNPKIKNLTTEKEISYNGISEGNIEITTKFGKKEVMEGLLAFNISYFGKKLKSIVYVEKYEKYFAVGDDGILFTSKNVPNWKSEYTGYTYDLNCIIYSQTQDLLVAVGTYGQIITSVDGETWVSKRVSTTQSLNKVVFSEEMQLFVIVGNFGYIYTSSDGDVWTKVEANLTMNLWGLTYSDTLEKFYAVGTSNSGTNYGITSSDGANWSFFSLPSLASNQGYKAIIYSDDLELFVVISSVGTILTSSDGETWTLRYTADPVCSLEDVVYYEDLETFIIVGGSGTIMTSSDGINWETQTNNITRDLYTIGKSEYLDQIIICGNGIILDSYDVANWNIQNNINIGANATIYSETKKIIIGVGTNGNIITSNDGEKWQNQNSGTTRELNSIAYSEELDLFCVVGNNGVILTSSDGTNWQAQTSGTTAKLGGILYNKDINKFVIAGYNIVLLSSDGINWETETLTSSLFEAITYAYDKQLYIAAGVNGVIKTSQDGINWEAQTSGFDANIYAIAYSENMKMFVCAGYGATLTSKDGINWITRNNNYLRNVYYINNAFLAIGINGIIYFSYDGKTWEQRTIYNGNQNFLSACFYKGKYIILSNTVIMDSTYNFVNAIQKISNNSDINFNIIVGENQIQIMKSSGSLFCKLAYRQKYIGV